MCSLREPNTFSYAGIRIKHSGFVAMGPLNQVFMAFVQYLHLRIIYN